MIYIAVIALALVFGSGVFAAHRSQTTQADKKAHQIESVTNLANYCADNQIDIESLEHIRKQCRTIETNGTPVSVWGLNYSQKGFEK